MLQIVDFQKDYSGFKVLDIPEITFDKGIHWIKGINGSGKSTFFKCVSGLIPFKGSIILDEKINLQKSPLAYRKLVNYGEAEPLYPGFITGNDLISFIAKVKQAPEAKVKELVERFDVSSFLENPTGSYSSGMMKKVSIILSFLGNPRLIILDEPFITIDTKAISVACLLIKEYAQNGTNFLISSHQTAEFDSLPINGTYIVKDQTIKPE